MCNFGLAFGLSILGLVSATSIASAGDMRQGETAPTGSDVFGNVHLGYGSTGTYASSVNATEFVPYLNGG